MRLLAAFSVVGVAEAGGSPYAYVLPRSSETAAAIRHAAMAKSKAAARPWPKAGLMTEGKKERPVR